LELIDQNFEKDTPVLLAGNSIHQDRRFIAANWPKLDARLHYRMLDVSAWKVVFEAKFKKRFAKPEEHLALSDIRGSIMELKYYLAKVKI
jgi:oligoribonuclease